MSMPDLTTIQTAVDRVLPRQARKYAWWVIVAVGLVLIGILGGYTAINETAPRWVTFALGVYAAIAGPGGGLMSLANLNPPATSLAYTAPTTLPVGDDSADQGADTPDATSAAAITVPEPPLLDVADDDSGSA